MELYLKQHVFTWGDRFTVYDENGEDAFYVEGEVFALGKKLHLLDLNGNELSYIHQKPLSLLPTFFIAHGNTDVARVVKQFTFLHQAYTVEGFGWQVEGDFLAHEYEIADASGTVASVCKRWLTWGDAYEISISGGYDIADVLSVVLVIDACLAMANSGG